MAQEVVEPQTAKERIGAFLFPLRGIPGILFLLVLLFSIGEIRGSWEFNWSLGLVLLSLGEGMRVFSRHYIGRSSSTRKAKVSRLVTGGPYQYVRHPIYIGNLGILAGFGVISGLWWTVFVFLPTVFILYYLISSYETRIVLARYPEEGSSFVASVSPWIPKFSTPSVQPSKPVPWKEVFRREGKTLLGVGLATGFLLIRELGWIPQRFFEI